MGHGSNDAAPEPPAGSEQIAALAAEAGRLEATGEPGALDEALELRGEIVELTRVHAPRRLLFEQRRLVSLLALGGDLHAATATCREMAAVIDAHAIDARPELVHAWWAVARAQLPRSRDAALDAVIAIARLWRFRECTHAIETTLRDARKQDGDLGWLAAMLRTRVLGELAKEPPPSAIEREIASDPKNPELYLVLADELTAAGDPRGELIAIHHAMRAQRTGALAAREYELLYHHHMRLLGPVDWGDAEWGLGYWRRVRLAINTGSLDRVRELVVHRSALVLETLVLDCYSLLEPAVNELAALVRHLPRIEVTYPESEFAMWLRARLPAGVVV